MREPIRRWWPTVGPAAIVLAVQLVFFPVPLGVWVEGAIIGGLTALVALGMALGARAADSAAAVMKVVEEFRTSRTDVTRKVDTLTIATLVIARWLITGRGASPSEIEWLGGVGAVSA